MNALAREILFHLLLYLQIDSARALCKLPGAWHGSWYQRGMNSLMEISINHVESKGHCLDVLSTQPYYLFVDRATRCTRCLLLIQRHVNLLQYRESECNDADDQLSVSSCPNLIAPDAVLYTLHRNNSSPHSCPLRPPYLFTELIKDGSVCHQSISSSYINQCANDYQFHLYLTPCLSDHPTLNQQYICVGTWMEHFQTYFITRIVYPPGSARKNAEDRYACFRYPTKSNTSLTLSMAMDDSCHDLNSKRMSTVMSLSSTRQVSLSNTSTESCRFPEEFQSHEWHSLNRSIRIRINANEIYFMGVHRRFHCVKHLHSDKSVRFYRVRSFTHCRMTEESLRIVQRTSNVIELALVSSIDEEEASISWTFFTRSISPCPSHLGHLIFQSDVDYYSKRKSLYMSIGCDQRDQISISQEATPMIRRESCLAWWQSDDTLTTYLLVQSSPTNVSYCLSFQLTNPIIIRNSTDGCSFDHSTDTTIYSARRLHPCSSSPTFPPPWTVLLLVVISLFSTDTSFQTVNSAEM